MAKDTPSDAGKPKEEPLFIQVWSEFHEAKSKSSKELIHDTDNSDSDGNFNA